MVVSVVATSDTPVMLPPRTSQTVNKSRRNWITGSPRYYGRYLNGLGCNGHRIANGNDDIDICFFQFHLVASPIAPRAS